jgi:hypothetical protein
VPTMDSRSSACHTRAAVASTPSGSLDAIVSPSLPQE